MAASQNTTWRKAVDPFGSEYYYDTQSRIPTWDAPVGVDISSIPLRQFAKVITATVPLSVAGTPIQHRLNMTPVQATVSALQPSSITNASASASAQRKLPKVVGALSDERATKFRKLTGVLTAMQQPASTNPLIGINPSQTSTIANMTITPTMTPTPTPTPMVRLPIRTPIPLQSVTQSTPMVQKKTMKVTVTPTKTTPKALKPKPKPKLKDAKEAKAKEREAKLKEKAAKLEEAKARQVITNASVPSNWISVRDNLSVHGSLAIYYYSLKEKKPLWEQPLTHLNFTQITTSIFRSPTIIDRAAKAIEEHDFTGIGTRVCVGQCTCRTKANCQSLLEEKNSNFKANVSWIDERLFVFKHPTKGNGLKTLMDHPKGSVIGYLHGEIILCEDWDKEFCVTGVPNTYHTLSRQKNDVKAKATAESRNWVKWDSGNMYFLAMSNVNNRANDLIVNSAEFGNLSRFINHSCEPNLSARIIYRNGFPAIELFSVRAIKADDELTLYYLENLKRHLHTHHKLCLGCQCGSRHCKLPPSKIAQALPCPGPGVVHGPTERNVERITVTPNDQVIAARVRSVLDYTLQFAPSYRKPATV